MPRFSSYRGFTLADARFYDDIHHFIAQGGFERQVQELAGDDVTVTRRGPWINCNPDGLELPPHGWKIHVSAVPDQAARALDVVIAEYRKERFAFKCLRDRDLVVSATSRWWQPGQVGKFITIYTRSAQECRDMLARLDPLLQGIDGPYILTDRRYKDSSCLYYRYGGFEKATVLRGPDGQEWEDDRKPAYKFPPWTEDLFPPEESVTKGPPSRVINGYKVTRALHFTGTGGLYLAERQADGATVILKESRPHTAFSTDGSSGQVRLRREHDVLDRLRDTGVGPSPIELFQAWEHLYLAEEFIEYGGLANFLAARSPLAHGNLSEANLALYREQVGIVLRNLRAAIGKCHALEVCYGDMSLTNIMVNADTLDVRLVDFESSRPFEQWNGQNPATPGFRPADGSATWTDPKAFDEFGLASVELALVCSRNVLRDLNPEALVRTSRFAAGLLKYPLGDLLHRLDLPEGDPDAPLPEIGHVVAETVRFAESTLTPERADRPFPASPEIFGTNPWSVSFGVSGLARGLHRLTGGVHPALEGWMAANADKLDDLDATLYSGQSGVGWTLLDIGRREEGLELIHRAAKADLKALPASIFEGSAGIGLACLAGWRRGGDESLRDEAVRIGEHIVETARDSGLGWFWPREGTPLRPLGYAYGSSGVASFLLYLHLATGEERFMRAARQALDFDRFQLQPRGGEGIGLPGHAGKPLLEPYWERGSSGFGGVLARFCKVTGDERMRATLESLVHWTLQGTALYPGLFSGAAGIVNFALDCRELLGIPYSGGMMSDDILTLACPQPEGIAFPGFGLLRYSTDFGAGGIGIALVLDRLANGGPDFNYTLDELLP